MNKKEDFESNGALQQWDKEGEELNGKMHKGRNSMIGVKGVGTIHGSESEHNKSNTNAVPSFKNVTHERNNGFSDFFLESEEKNHYDDKVLDEEKKATCISENKDDYSSTNNNDNNNVEKQVDGQCNFTHINGNIKEKADECDNLLQKHTISIDVVNDGKENTNENGSTITESNADKLKEQQNDEFINKNENVHGVTEQRIVLIENTTNEENNMNVHSTLGGNVFEKVKTGVNQTAETDVLYYELNNQTNEENMLCTGFEQKEMMVVDTKLLSFASFGNDNKNDSEVLLNEMKTHSDANILPSTVERNIPISDAKDTEVSATHEHMEVEIKPEEVCEKKEDENEKNANAFVESTHKINVAENDATSLNNVPNSTQVTEGNQWLQEETYESTVSNIIEFHKNMKELNLGRGEIFLNEHEYVVTSYLLLNNGFRFFPCEETTVPKKRKDLYKRDSQWVEKKIQRSGSMDMNKMLEKSPVKHEGVVDLQKKMSLETNVEIGLGEEHVVTEEVNVTQEEGNFISEESRERKEMVNEILNGISSLCAQLLSVEGNFKNLKNNIEENAFTFNCIVEKMKNDKYGNILYLYNDIYLYFNNLLFLSKPSSRNWMKLHELSVQITNTMFNVQQRRENRWEERRKTLRKSDDQNLNGQIRTRKNHITENKENDNKIKEEEKRAFQELLSRVHQDVHYELYMRFKNKAVWKTLEGGEIELNDQLTNVRIFREMYKWCKEKSEVVGRNKGETESSSSEDSY